MTTDDDIPSRQSIEAKGRSAPMRVSGKLKVALQAMLYEGLSRDDAAKRAGLAIHSLREAFKKPHVLAFYNEGLVIRRTSERARNISRLVDIRDAADNQPAINAIRALEGTDEDDRSRIQIGVNVQLAGYVIDCSPLPRRPPVDVSPRPQVIEHDEHPNAAFKPLGDR
jgi:hypothetical protein